MLINSYIMTVLKCIIKLAWGWHALPLSSPKHISLNHIVFKFHLKQWVHWLFKWYRCCDSGHWLVVAENDTLRVGRIQYCSQEIVIIREDLVNKMCRNCVRMPTNSLDIPNHVRRNVFQRLQITIESQVIPHGGNYVIHVIFKAPLGTGIGNELKLQMLWRFLLDWAQSTWVVSVPIK